jgi:hypothetical protein
VPGAFSPKPFTFDDSRLTARWTVFLSILGAETGGEKGVRNHCSPAPSSAASFSQWRTQVTLRDLQLTAVNSNNGS